MSPLSLVLFLTIAAPIPADLTPKHDAYSDPLPAGAIDRYGTLRYRGGSTSGAAFLADGKTIVSAGSDNHLYFWETETGKLVRRYEAFASYNPQFAVSPDGKQVV